MIDLPIDEVMPEIIGQLKKSDCLVLRAPPGAGKTTWVPGALLDAGLIDGRIVMLEPRRVAARSAARRIAKERGVRVGGEVGYKVRFEDRTSKGSKIIIVTEGLLARQLQQDPGLEGVGAVILDEFHERSVHTDMALAFLREVQLALRPELKIIVMSATLDTGPIAEYLGDCPIVESAGRTHPVERSWLDRPDDRRLEDLVSAGVRRAIREDPNGKDILVFLPGARDIQRVAEKLEGTVEADIRPLYGALDAKAQDAAIAPGPKKKIVLATNIAESSITIEGVTAVVDSGLEKLVRHDPARGVDRLDTVRISKASAVQRAGRAGRTRAGRAYHLWTAAEERRLAESASSEISRVDLAPILLDVIAWSSADPRAFGWFETPPEAMMQRGLRVLRALGALKRGQFKLTGRGETIRAFPLHPRIAAAMVEAHGRGVVQAGALVCALASERDILRRGAGTDVEGDSDLLVRADVYTELARSGFSHGLANRIGADLRAARSIGPVRDQLASTARRVLGKSTEVAADDETLRRVLLAGFADRVAKRRSKGSDKVVLVGGRGGKLSPDSVVKNAELMVAIEIDDSQRKADSLVRMASSIDESWVKDELHEVSAVRFNTERRAVEASIEVRYHDLVLRSRRDQDADPNSVAECLAEAASKNLGHALDLDRIEPFRRRVAFVARHCSDEGIEPLDDERLKAMLPSLCVGLNSFAGLQKLDLVTAIRNHLGYPVATAIDRLAPKTLDVGTRRPLKLRYENEGPPVLSVRLQWVFGLEQTPMVAGGRVPVKVELLAPNMRPVQVTQDLASFWDNTYIEVRKQLRARYPKHAWPEDPRKPPPPRTRKK